MAVNTSTVLKNISGRSILFSFLFGRTLADGELTEIPGDIYAFLGSNPRTVRAYQEALTNGLLEIVSSPTSPSTGQQYRPPLQTLTQLRAVTVADRTDKDIRLVEDAKAVYRFDLESSATADGDLVIQPDSGSGRWIKTSRIQGKLEEVSFLAPTISNGQTVFALPEPYDGVGVAILSVNGVTYDQGINFTLAGTVLTWLDVPFVLGTTKSLSIRYQTTTP